MKRLLLFASVLFLALSCSDRNSANLKVAIKGADTLDVVLQRLNYNKLQPIDTIRTDENGAFDYKVSLANESPAFYYLYCNDRKIASMILLPGDRVNIDADLSGNYTISGSEESVKLQEVEAELADVKAQMAQIVSQVDAETSDDQIKVVNSQLSRLYIDYKRSLTRKMMVDSTSLTSAIAAFYKINDNLPVFNEYTDAILFRTVYDKLSKVYPKSEYLQALLEEADKRERAMEFDYKLSEMEEVGFPDITMPDADGQSRSLKDLSGKVVLLMFWSATIDDQKMMNHDLLELYDSYHDKGFEIYQVALDIDKATWASVVKSQQIPWISVNDGQGTSSPALLMYRVSSIPTAFLISRDGSLIYKDLTSVSAIEEQLKKLL